MPRQPAGSRKETGPERPALQVRSKVWLEAGGVRVFGPGLFRILGLVARQGSLKLAVQSAGMSYRYAWDLVRQAEKRLGAQLVAPHAGGAHGGGTDLTPEADRLLELFERLNAEVSAYAVKRFEAHLRKGAMASRTR